MLFFITLRPHWSIYVSNNSRTRILVGCETVINTIVEKLALL